MLHSTAFAARLRQFVRRRGILFAVAAWLVGYVVLAAPAAATTAPTAAHGTQARALPADLLYGAAQKADEERLQAWCRALSTSPRRRTAFELLLRAGEAALPVLTENYEQANEIGRHLTLLLLAAQPGEISLSTALAVVTDPDDTPRAHSLARFVVRQQPAQEAQAALAQRFAAARDAHEGNPDRFALRQMYRVLGDLSVANALAVFDGFVPSGPTGQAESREENWRRLELELWQTALLRASLRTPIPAYQRLDALRRDHAQAVTPLLHALDAYRRASSDLRHLTDRRHSVRVRAERALISLCREHPLMANVLLTHEDYRVRAQAVERLGERRSISALVFAFEALDDSDRAIASKALETLTRYGPAAPELLDVLTETVPSATRTHLEGLAEAFPPAEELAYVREQRERLRELLVPMVHQRTLHDPATAEVYRAWSQLQTYWQRLATAWTRWWNANGESFRPQPYRQLVHVLMQELR